MPERRDLPAQTALRGIAAFTVFLAHANFCDLFPEVPVLGRIYAIFYWHNVAVDLFFQLSGFILCYVYGERDFTWPEYALARFSRIYPLYLVTLVVILLMNFMAYWKTGVLTADRTASEVMANIFLVQNWPGPNCNSINFPAWSISVEVFLYLMVFPPLLDLRNYLSIPVSLLLAGVSVIILTLLYTFFPVASPWHPDDELLRGILSFTSGFFVCSVGLHYGFSCRIPCVIESLFLLLVAGTLFCEFPFGHNYSGLLFPLLVYLCAQPTSVTAALLQSKLLCWLGDISYSIYLWHWPLLKALPIIWGQRFVGEGAPESRGSLEWRLLLVAFTILLVLGLSHFSHFYFERPIVKWMKRRLGRSLDVKSGRTSP